MPNNPIAYPPRKGRPGRPAADATPKHLDHHGVLCPDRGGCCCCSSAQRRTTRRRSTTASSARQLDAGQCRHGRNPRRPRPTASSPSRRSTPAAERTRRRTAHAGKEILDHPVAAGSPGPNWTRCCSRSWATTTRRPSRATTRSCCWRCMCWCRWRCSAGSGSCSAGRATRFSAAASWADSARVRPGATSRASGRSPSTTWPAWKASSASWKRSSSS